MDKIHVCEKEYFCHPSKCNCENGKYLANIMDDSAIIYDEVIEPHEGEINLNEKKAICKTQSLYILLPFLLIN